MKIIIVNENNYFKKNFNINNVKCYHINDKKNFTLKKIKKINPNILFFPHWHWKVDKKIIEKYLCIGFHCAPLPKGRGGSPIQNQIIRGKKITEICAIKFNNIIDGGPVYIRKKFKLNGNANEIFLRLYKDISKMINRLVKNLPTPIAQKGKVEFLKRRTPEQSEIDFKNFSIEKIFNHIRMLDLDFKNFPKAFFNIGSFKIIFSNIKKEKRNLVSKVKIIRLKNKN